jgi:hypothetical protein
MAMARKVKAASLVGGLMLAAGLVLSPAKQASAQQGVQWTTGFQVQNLGTSAANVSIDLIDRNGAITATIPDQSIGLNASKTYFPVPNVAAGFQGSAIISADQPVAAILNILGNNGVAGQAFYSESATGITQGSTGVNLPLIQRGNSGFNTWIAVQNTGASQASVTITYKAGGAGNNYTAPAVSIAPGASAIFDQSTETNLGAKFVGSATVTSAQPLAVIVNQVGTGNLKQLLTYSGFSGGSNSMALPLVQQANGGFSTGISIQNSGAVDANVTVTYGPNLVAGGAALTADTATLQPGQSTVFLKSAAAKYVGSATVTTAAANQEVVVVVNQSSATSGTSYEGLNTATATNRVSAPLLMAANGGFFTGVQCRNVGSGSTNITITYSPNTVPGSTFSPPATTVSDVAAGGAANIQQNFAQKYVGGGVISTSPESNIVCIVNQLNNTPGAGDAFLTYNGINY